MIVKLVTHTYFFLHLSSKWGYTACEMLRFTSIVEFSAACSMHSFIWQRSKSRVISCTEHKQSHWFHTYYMSTTEPPIHQPTCFTNPYIPFHTSPLQSFLYSEAKTIPYTVKKELCIMYVFLTADLLVKHRVMPIMAMCSQAYLSINVPEFFALGWNTLGLKEYFVAVNTIH